MKGYIQIKTLPNLEPRIFAELEGIRKTEENGPIRSLDTIYGEYDIIIRVEAKDEEEFLQTLWTIAALNGVTATSTMIVISRDFVMRQLKRLKYE